MTALLELTIRRKAFDSDPLFENLSIEIVRGERMVIMGPSGIGKTTLLTILAGLDDAFDGQLRRYPELGLRVGVMFQAPRLMPWLTVAENVALVMGSGAQRASVSELLQAVELGGLQNAYPKHLSGGMQRRVALARALANDPHLLILDEPFVSLDDALSVRLYRRVLDTLAPSVAVVMATHDLGEAVTLADRILVLDGRPANVAAEEALTAPRPRSRDTVVQIERRLRPLLDRP